MASGAPAWGAPKVMKAVHVAACLVSVATCLYVAAHWGPHLQAPASRPRHLGGGWAHRLMQPGGASSSSSDSSGGSDDDEGSSSGGPLILSDWNRTASLEAMEVLEQQIDIISPRNLSHLDSCLAAVRDGTWRRVIRDKDPIPLPMEIASWQMQDNFTELGRTGETKLKFEWAWAVPSLIKCGVRRRMPPEIAAALSYKRVVFIGDAHVRRVHNWLAWALLGEEVPDPKKGRAPKDLRQSIAVGDIRLELYNRDYVDGIIGMLQGWEEESDWPDVLVLGAAEWHLRTQGNLSQYTEAMEELLGLLQDKMPPTTFLAWLSPPAQHYRKAVKAKKLELGPEWVRVYDRVAQDTGFYQPEGPAFHLDLFQVALDCLPWCTSDDGTHVEISVNMLMVQHLVNAYLMVLLEGDPITPLPGSVD